MIRIWSFALFLLSATTVCASDAGPLPAERVAPGEFDKLVVEVRRDLAPGGRYSKLDADRRVVLETALTEIQGLLDNVTSLQQMSPETQITLVNAYHRANAALADGEFDPIVCKRAIPTGSKFRKTSCRPESEIREESRVAQDTWNDRLIARP